MSASLLFTTVLMVALILKEDISATVALAISGMAQYVKASYHYRFVKEILLALCILDIDECQQDSTSVCGPHSSCKNTIGSYRCDCEGGYQYDSSGLTCIGKMCRCHSIHSCHCLKLSSFLLFYLRCKSQVNYMFGTIHLPCK